MTEYPTSPETDPDYERDAEYLAWEKAAYEAYHRQEQERFYEEWCKQNPPSVDEERSNG